MTKIDIIKKEKVIIEELDRPKGTRRRFSQFSLSAELDSRVNSICNLFRSPDPQESTLKVFEIFLLEYGALSFESEAPAEYRKKMLYKIQEYMAQNSGRKPFLCTGIQNLLKAFQTAWGLDEGKK